MNCPLGKPLLEFCHELVWLADYGEPTFVYPRDGIGIHADDGTLCGPWCKPQSAMSEEARRIFAERGQRIRNAVMDAMTGSQEAPKP
ncbi:MAG: hypothetical protein KGL39_06685 [Patescibacteria group bacterium]|nr:hypothetical protein [Patescibacteria group bacterium]